MRVFFTGLRISVTLDHSNLLYPLDGAYVFHPVLASAECFDHQQPRQLCKSRRLTKRDTTLCLACIIADMKQVGYLIIFICERACKKPAEMLAQRAWNLSYLKITAFAKGSFASWKKQAASKISFFVSTLRRTTSNNESMIPSRSCTSL